MYSVSDSRSNEARNFISAFLTFYLVTIKIEINLASNVPTVWIRIKNKRISIR